MFAQQLEAFFQAAAVASRQNPLGIPTFDLATSGPSAVATWGT